MSQTVMAICIFQFKKKDLVILLNCTFFNVFNIFHFVHNDLNGKISIVNNLRGFLFDR